MVVRIAADDRISTSEVARIIYYSDNKESPSEAEISKCFRRFQKLHEDELIDPEGKGRSSRRVAR